VDWRQDEWTESTKSTAWLQDSALQLTCYCCVGWRETDAPGWSLPLDSAGAVGLVVSMTAAPRTITLIFSD
jgi:hypothetical protein